MPSAAFPRLLVVAGFPPSASGGGAAVTRQVLRDWPENLLHWWCPYPQPRDPRSGNLSWPKAPEKIFPRARFRRLKTMLTQILWVPLASKHLRRTIAQFSPDVVWCIPHEWCIPVAGAVLPRNPIPYAVYIQDYPTTNQMIEIVGARTAARWMQILENLVRRARFVDTTSYPMGQDIARRTECPSIQMLHEGLESSDLERLSRPSTQGSDSRFTLAFAGTVVAEDALAESIRSLEKIRHSLPQTLHINFYSSHSYAQRPWFNPEWMTECGYMERNELIAALQRCQAGLVVMDSNESNSSYNKFSFPTKFITYLAAGIEPVVVGHESSAVAALVKESGVGMHFADAASLGEAIPSLMRRGPVGNRRKIAEFARAHFDAAQKRQQFREQISASAGYA